MNVYRMFVYLFFAAILSACGGTSETSPADDNPAGSDSSISDNTPEPEPEPVIKSTADLKTTAEFELKSTETLELVLSIAGLPEQRAYLYVCHLETNETLDRGRCLVKTPILDGAYSGTFNVGNDVEGLGLEVWSYVPNAEPVQHFWSRSEDTMNWTVSL